MGQEKIWSHFQNEGSAAFDAAMPRYRFIARRVARQLAPHSRILNIGVGSGRLEEILKAQGFQVSALDPDERAVQRLLDNGVDARVGIIQQLPFEPGSFDAVVASEVLEHLDPDVCRQGVSEIGRTLKPRGILIGTVPYRERLGDSATVCPKCGHQFHRWGHAQSFDEEALKVLFRREFDVLRLTRRAFVAFGAKPVGFAKSTVQWLLGRMGEPIADPHWHFECRRCVGRSVDDQRAA